MKGSDKSKGQDKGKGKAQGQGDNYGKKKAQLPSHLNEKKRLVVLTNAAPTNVCSV